MINYVNNAYDKCLKPCDAQQFSNIINSPKTEELITLYRSGDSRAKPNLPALTYMGVFDKEKWPPSNPPKGGGTRKAELMRPTGLLMLDFDHVAPLSSPQGGKTPTDAIDSPVKLWEFIKSRYDAIAKDMSSPLGGSEGGSGVSSIALAHITPSGDGLRVVVKRPVGMTIEQAQYEWCQAMELDKVGIKPDAACKDISRLSFAPMQKEVLYYNPSLLFAPLPEAGDYPDERAPLFSPQGGMTSTANATAVPVPLPLGGGWEGAYNGIPYAEIVARLEEQLGGRPERGARNSFIFTMACNLRYICNDDAQWVASILPTYGEEPQKHRMTIQSAINRPMSREMPETLKRALGVAKAYVDNGQQTTDNRLLAAPPAMPAVLPAPIALLTSRTPHPMKEAVAMAVFPPLGAHLYKTEFMYIDNRPYEATFMNLLMAELSAGKSAVNLPIELSCTEIG